MITKIEISNAATYKSATAMCPKAINFIFGGNGTGKTTLSRFLAGEYKNPESSIEWSSPDHEKIVVYNRDFIEQNFSEDKSLPGIFTLGSESIDLQNEIDELKNQQNQEKESREKERNSLNKLKEELNSITDDAKEKCWNIQVKYGYEFADALVGFRGSKEQFFRKCLSFFPLDSAWGDPIPSFEQLKDAYNAAFTKSAAIVAEYSEYYLSDLATIDLPEILSKVITGKANTPIGTFIQFLNAGDWVKQGLIISKSSKGRCPFCQRVMPDDLAQQIADFFDEEYEKDCATLVEYKDSYSSFVLAVQKWAEDILNKKYTFLQYEGFEQLYDQFVSLAKQNITIIQSKIDTPSKVVAIDSVANVLERLNDHIKAFNAKIKENNDIIADQNRARITCKELVWQFLVNQARDIINEYQKKSSGLNRGIKQIEGKITTYTEKIGLLEKSIIEKESKLTSVLPTVTAINRILEGFGFSGFSLAENQDKKGTYLIVRPDGSDASRTLSEGEHNFISFLYFYHLCFGSQTSTGITDDKILVIDDPISSLDSNVLFVIATLVKSVIQNCRKKEKGISQVFVLTHNIYFHKEVTYLGSRDQYSPKEVAFFIIRKKDEESTIVPYQDNPIKTSYEILWDELRSPTTSSVKSVFNTMRRILEHYFQVIGGIKYEECINEFEGEDKYICKALIAFINDGSHSIFDDLVVSFDETSLENYLRVFRMIFERLHHIDHYNMMMKRSEPN